jgi:hypothetical protein
MSPRFPVSAIFLAAAGEPKRFVLVEARNHRFDGNQPEFFRQLRAMIEWVNTAQR